MSDLFTVVAIHLVLGVVIVVLIGFPWLCISWDLRRKRRKRLEFLIENCTMTNFQEICSHLWDARYHGEDVELPVDTWGTCYLSEDEYKDRGVFQEIICMCKGTGAFFFAAERLKGTSLWRLPEVEWHNIGVVQELLRDIHSSL